MAFLCVCPICRQVTFLTITIARGTWNSGCCTEFSQASQPVGTTARVAVTCCGIDSYVANSTSLADFVAFVWALVRARLANSPARGLTARNEGDRAETRPLLALFWPIIIANLGQTGYATDKASRGPHELFAWVFCPSHLR